MNEMYLQGFINKCAQAGVDPEALLEIVKKAAADSDPEDYLVYDYLAQLVPGVGPLTLGGLRAGRNDESVIGGAAKGLAGSVLGSAVGGLGGGIVGTGLGEGIGKLKTKLKAFQLNKKIKDLERAAARTSDFKHLAQIKKDIFKLRLGKMMNRLSLLPALGTVGYGLRGAGLGALVGGAHGLRYATKNPKKSKDKANTQNNQ